MSVEGGFQGRTNKLVDGCYSMWVGALGPILKAHLPPDAMNNHWLFNRGNIPLTLESLQKYILSCCQTESGGLRDKIGRFFLFLFRHPDYYHTCYTLCGLSIAQHYPSFVDGEWVAHPEDKLIVGPSDNCLGVIDPIYGVRIEKIKTMKNYFKHI
jgi:prenyltransferase beta subunit